MVAGMTLGSGSVAIIADQLHSTGAAYGKAAHSPATTEPTTTPLAKILARGVVVSAGGSAVTLSGTTYSILPSDRSIVVHGQIKQLHTAAPQSIFTVGSQIFTADPSGFAVNGNIVVLKGSPITLAGTVVSLGSMGLQVASETVPLIPSQGSGGGGGLGNIVLSGFGSESGTEVGNSSTSSTFTGTAMSIKISTLRVAFAAFGLVLAAVIREIW